MAEEEVSYSVEYLDASAADDDSNTSNWLSRSNCTAKVTYSNGDTYVGAFNEDKLKHGSGKYTWVTKSADNEATETASYDGSYDAGKKSGIGKMIFPNGDSYHGQWSNDVMSGEGTFVYANGDIYSGSFVNGIKSGDAGTYEFAADQSRLVGKWENGVLVSGTWCSVDGREYVGTFDADANGQPIGAGVFNFPNGSSLAGEYRKAEEGTRTWVAASN